MPGLNQRNDEVKRSQVERAKKGNKDVSFLYWLEYPILIGISHFLLPQEKEGKGKTST